MLRRIATFFLLANLLASTTHTEATPNNHWAETAITNCVQLGLIRERDFDWYDETVKPAELYEILEAALDIRIPDKTDEPEITRDQMTKVLAGILEPENTTTPALEICKKYDIIEGFPDNDARQDEPVTNAQACAITIRMIKALCEYPPEVPKTAKQLTNGKPITYQNIWNVIQEFKAKYPTGTLWAWSDTVGTEYYHDAPSPDDPDRDISALNANMPNAQTHTPTSLKYGCGGFSCMLSELLLGKTGFPCREVFETEKAMPGDIVYFVDDDGYTYHIATVYKLYKTGEKTWFQTAAANEYDQVRFSDDVEKQFCQIDRNCRVFTRYQAN